MSAIAGVLKKTDGLVAPEHLYGLSESLAQQGPDGAEVRIEGPVGMVHRPFHTSSESRKEGQPLRTTDGLMLSWDGRLDNRMELGRALGVESTNQTTDGDLVVAAYRRWGVNFPLHIIGDFALSIWDSKAERLMLARDPFGLRMLFYHEVGEQVSWASTIGALIDNLEVPLDLDENFLAEYLTFSRLSDLTPFKHIKAVEPAGYLVIERGSSARKGKYWHLNPENEIRYGSDKEYEEHFREIFYQAVGSRLRVDGPVAAELSGGLDSSSIVCVADDLLARKQFQVSELKTLSYVFDKSPESDERRFIRYVEDQRGLQGFHLREEDHPFLDRLPQKRLDFPTPEHLGALRQNHIRQKMDEIGSRVLLRGIAGDHVLCAGVMAPFELADFLVQGNPQKAIQSVSAWAKALRKPIPQVLWEGMVWPLLPVELRAKTNPFEKVQDWMDPTFVQRARLRQRLVGQDDCGFRLPSHRERYQTFQNLAMQVSWGFYLEDGVIEVSCPFLDRRLVEFCMAIPMSQKARPGDTRSVMRRALQNVLPEKIATRRCKGGPDQAIFRALVRNWKNIERYLENPRVAELGIVDAEMLRSFFQGARHGADAHTPALLRIFSLEHWLRNFESRTLSVGKKPRLAA